MGLRDRLKQQVQRAIGRGDPSPRPAAPAPRPPAPLPPAPAPVAPLPPKPPPTVVAPPPVVALPPAPPPVVALPPMPTAPVHAKVHVEDHVEVHSDAPVRNAHHRPDFQTTAQALPVRVFDPTTQAWLAFPCEPGETVLEGAERAGLVLPYSCRSGGCLSCTGRLQAGEAEQGEQYVLEPEQLEAGFRLLCCTTVTTPAEFLGHQEDNVQ